MKVNKHNTDRSHLLCDLAFRAADHHFGQGEQGDDVGNDHEVVEHIRQLPHQIVAHHGAHQDEHQGDEGVDHGAGLGVLLAEKPDGVDLAEEIPAQDRGEGKEEQADSHELGAQAGTHHGAEGGLGQVGLAEGGGHIAHIAARQRAVSSVEGADDDQRVEGQHHEGVDEHADHRHNALLVRILHVGLSVGMGGRAHTGLVGEQTTLGALRDGLLDGVAERTAHDGLRLKGVLEDHAEGGGDVPDAEDQDDQTAQQEDRRHNGDDFFRNGGQPLNAAQENDAADDDQRHAHDPGGDAESGLEALSDGVGLHHAAHEAQSQNDGDCEQGRQEFAEAALERGGDVIDRAAVDGAVCCLDPRLDGQCGFSVDGGHAEEGDDPHPEDGAGAAGQDGTGCAYDVAGAHLSGNGGGQCLKGAHAAVMLFAVEGQIAEDSAHTLAEAADLNEAGLDAVPQADSHQQKDQNVVGQVRVDAAYSGIKRSVQFCDDRFHSFFLLHTVSPTAGSLPR